MATPLEKIKQMNLENEAKQQAQAEAEQNAKNEAKIKTEHGAIEKQNKIDSRYINLGNENKVLVEDIEQLKQKVLDIKGTREEMINQYHQVIAEAKKNPETLKYVREHFAEIFSEEKGKWQGLREKLNLTKQSEKEKNKAIEKIKDEISNLFPETTEGKNQAENEKNAILEQKNRKERQKENLNREINQQKEIIEKLIMNIENAKSQKGEYKDILNQKVEYTRNQFLSGEAQIISEDARKFTELWKQFPVNPWVASIQNDYMVNELQKKNYSNREIENYKAKRKELDETREKIENSLQQNKPRASLIGFARSNDIRYPSFPYLNIGHGNHYFESELLGKQMTLGELFDKEIELKTKRLGKEQEKLKELEEKIKEFEAIEASQ